MADITGHLQYKGRKCTKNRQIRSYILNDLKRNIFKCNKKKKLVIYSKLPYLLYILKKGFKAVKIGHIN